MTIKQKISDVVLLLQKDRKVQLVAGVVGVFIIVLIIDPFASPRKRGPRKAKKQIENGTGALSNTETYQDLITAFRQNVESLQDQTRQNAEQIGAIGENMANFEERTAEIFKKILVRIEEQEKASYPTYNPGQQGTAPPVEMAMANDLAPIEPDALASFGELSGPEAIPPAPPPPRRIAYIGPGDSVRVKLIAGVEAPTNGTPYPVLFKLEGDVDGPDGTALPLGEARLIAAAQGSIGDQRVLFRLTDLSMRFPDGRRKTMKVDGWIVGEDGIRGMKGILVDPMGKAMAAAGLVGFTEAVGDGMAKQQVTEEAGFYNTASNLTGSVGEYALGKGISNAAETWNDMLRERVRQIPTLVKIYSGREATAVFAKSLEIPGLFAALEDSNNDFASLD